MKFYFEQPFILRNNSLCVTQRNIASPLNIATPLTRIAMDIVGPLDKSRAGHCNILVVCDYTTCYPEAFPL